jgi:tetratricopeptide (TPR) repeat protein
MNWESRVQKAWISATPESAVERIRIIEELASERQSNDTVALYERASAQDAYGSEYEAEPLYRAAISAGLYKIDPSRNTQAFIQLASTLRNLGKLHEATATLAEAEKLDLDPDQANWVRAFQLLCKLSMGEEVFAKEF